MIKSLDYRLYVVMIAMLLVACARIDLNEVVSTNDAPVAIGPYSQAIKSGNILFLSGQIPIDPKTDAVMAGGTIEEQTELVIRNMGAVLEANGMTLADVVSTQVFMNDLEEFPRMNAVYGRYFAEKPPARSTIEAARLPRDVKIEISAMAVKQQTR